MEAINSEQQFQDKIASSGTTIVVFKADWCKDCHFIDPFMPDVIKKYEKQVSFYEVDRDELADLCSQYNILGIPSFIAFKAGEELIRFVSKLRKTREEIEHFVDRAIQVSASLEK